MGKIFLDIKFIGFQYFLLSFQATFSNTDVESVA